MTVEENCGESGGRIWRRDVEFFGRDDVERGRWVGDGGNWRRLGASDAKAGPEGQSVGIC